MRHLLGLSVLFVSFATGAFAQNQSPAANQTAAATIKPGLYSGRVVDEKKGTRSADVKITVKSITDDGRVTARVQSSHARKSCQKSLPLNGLVLPDGKMRLEVSDGAPTGCARIYNVTLVPGGSVSGTFLDA